jgi:ABC-2 type transport system permease protein
VFTSSLYIIVCSARNRARVRLRRLREPRYLLGAIVGAAYVYFTFFARMRAGAGAGRSRRGGSGPPLLVLSALRATAASLVGVGLLAVSAVAWVLPFDSGLLDFSAAEVQFLFPAPVSRRALLAHRMLRSQIGLLFGGLIMGVAIPSVSGYGRLRAGIGAWLLLSIGKVYFTGVSLARTRLAKAEDRARWAAWVPLVVLAAAIAVVARAVAPVLASAGVTRPQDLLLQLGAATSNGAAAVALWPFAAVAAPLFAAAAVDFVRALIGAALVLGAAIVWVLQTDAAFEDAAATAAERKAASATRTVTYRVRRGSVTLAPRGRPEGAFAWKAATQTLRLVNPVALARVAAVVIVLTGAAVTVGRTSGLPTILGTLAIVSTVFLVLMAPQILRVDLRDDLRHLELLKTWPVPAAALIRGQLLWPSLVLTLAAWTTLIAGELLAAATPFARVSLSWRVSIGAAAALLTPALIAAQLTINNAAAVLFPAWVPLGHQRPRGLDAMGQRLILLGATWLLLIVSVLPGAIVGAVVWIGLSLVLGPAAVVPAAGCCAAAVGAEVLLATEALGPAYDRLDATAVEPAE